MERFVRALESCFWGNGGGVEHEEMGLRQWGEVVPLSLRAWCLF